MFKLSRLEKAKKLSEYEASGEGRQAWLRDQVVEAIKQVYDPEIPVNIYDLGLIYSIDVDDSNAVAIQMTLTSPACPVAGSLPGQVEGVVRSLDEVNEVQVELVWDPPWDRSRMTEEALLELTML